MYQIYHIKGIKIGCTTNVERRVKQQGYSEYEILETHSDIKVASKREKELQSIYGYDEKNVRTLYEQHYNFALKGVEAAKGLGAKTQIENKIGMFGYTKEERTKINTKNAPKGGLAQSQVLRECPHCGKVGKGNGMFTHFKICENKLNYAR